MLLPAIINKMTEDELRNHVAKLDLLCVAQDRIINVNNDIERTLREYIEQTEKREREEIVASNMRRTMARLERELERKYLDIDHTQECDPLPDLPPTKSADE